MGLEFVSGSIGDFVIWTAFAFLVGAFMGACIAWSVWRKRKRRPRGDHANTLARINEIYHNERYQ